MVKFVKRLTAPRTTDKNWIHYSKGGNNSCILIKGNSCIPNCVGYVWGRWHEILGKAPKLSRGNAENWWAYKDGYKRGQTPKLGAVGVYRKGKAGVSSDGAGHVVIVEEIYANGDILISQSAYGGDRFTTKKLYKSNGYNGFGSQVFLGFIYLPIEFDDDEKEEENDEKYTLFTSVDTFTNASNAMNHKNKVGSYPKGSYYVFKRAYGMINITRKKGTAGAWINPSDNVKESNIEYYPKCKIKTNSIVDGLNSIGVDGSFINRENIAIINGIKGYEGSPKQNTDMLNKLKAGTLIKSKK